MEIEFNGKKHKLEKGATPIDVAKAMNVDLKNVLVARVNGLLFDLRREINEDAKIEFLTFDSDDGEKVFWHSTAHVLAAAVKKLYPDAMITLGPPIDEGFFYDFYNLKVGDNDLPVIEKEMKKIVEADEKFIRKETTVEEAKRIFGNNKFKIEILGEEAKPPITVYENGEFMDLCRGPHIPSTRYIKAFRLLKVAGAYWRGDSKREVLTRIYGISFPSKAAMEEYNKFEVERSKHDHKKIGKELELFDTSPLSPGSPFFLPNGAIVYNELLKLSRELDAKYGYQEIITPIIAKSDVWKISGHYEKYKDSMFRVTPFSNDKQEYGLKPMNCPFSTVVFKTRTRSYRELPLRFSDYGMLHRYELEGTLDGLLRTWMFEQNDAHTYLTEDQIEDELMRVLDLMETAYSYFKLVPIMKLCTRPKERIGSEEEWDKGETALRNVLEKRKCKYTVNEGDGAFYGPKIDVYVLDFTGRPEAAYAVFTVQIDFNLARRFDVKYVGPDNKEHVPIVLHRAFLGSIGRFMGIILENTAGNLPLWLSPAQVRIINITERNKGYSEKVLEAFKRAGIRADSDFGNNTLDYRIREGQLKRIPYVVVIGDKEEKEEKIAVRTRDGKTKYGVNPGEFIGEIRKLIDERVFSS